MKLKGYEQDDEKVKKGALVSLGRNPDGTMRTIRVRSTASIVYENRLEAIQRPVKRLIDRDKELARECVIEALADTVLLDWENLLDENDQPIPVTRANKLILLRGGEKDGDPDTFNRSFFMDVIVAAGTRETFLSDEDWDAKKASQPSSTGI